MWWRHFPGGGEGGGGGRGTNRLSDCHCISQIIAYFTYYISVFSWVRTWKSAYLTAQSVDCTHQYDYACNVPFTAFFNIT